MGPQLLVLHVAHEMAPATAPPGQVRFQDDPPGFIEPQRPIPAPEFVRRAAQRGPLNTECKLMLLRHAFEALDCIAVEFRTPVLNHQSRRAIERLGARFDGILRAHMVMANGTLRDTAVYSIVAPEWPTVRAHLEWQLVRPR